ncbi:hypothetical protein RRF57_003200 [Xylaria bambusicola]|uniref:Uncharacterized protein n=1 Tax=Xylaria bambusicola TaxID=326684 RepID=A0AAN7YW79_9PEZI
MGLCLQTAPRPLKLTLLHIMGIEVYTLQEVLAIASVHPFYHPRTQYPLDASEVQIIRKNATQQTADQNLKSFPLLWKSHLYTTIQRLVDDTSPQNTYRHNVYASTTGGGYGKKPLFFATDAGENRRQRAAYDRLDLVLEVLENAGASVLSAGNHMPAAQVAALLAKYHVNVLTGDSSQVIKIVHHISTLSKEERDEINIDKIIYTSEMLTSAQRAHIKLVLGQIKICSLFASAEAGPWCASNPGLTGHNIGESCADFIFDTRTALIEIFPTVRKQDDGLTYDPLPDGEQGMVVQTSLARLRNPLVRYVTGDIGSLHPLPDHARNLLSEADWRYLRVLRLAGRDRRFSFDWDGEYIEFEGLTAIMNAESSILQWQVILGTMAQSKESSLEVRILCAARDHEGSSPVRQVIADRVTDFLHVYDMNRHRFQLRFVESMDGFERSATGRKVIKFLDRYNE